MPVYTFRGAAGGLLTVSAPDEAQARRLAMQEAYGKRPDNVTPQAYMGLGLTLVETPNEAKPDLL